MMIEKPPASVEVGGVLYKVDTDFRTMIEIENLITSKSVTERQEAFAKEIMQYAPDVSFEEACANAKYHEALTLFYKGGIPEDLEGAIEKLVWFYGCGKPETSRNQGKQGKKPLYSYSHDFDYINAGFIQDYKLDLLEVESLHWWKFVSLFSALRDDCKIREIMGYRGADMKGMDKEQRKFVKEMKKRYALPEDVLTAEEEELKNKLRDALLNGGDVSGILNEKNVCLIP